MGRATDTADTTFFQSDRFFRSEGMWFFVTREGIDFGPFTLRYDGEKALARYIDTQKTMTRLRARDPALGAERQWHDQSVARAARDVSDWRLQGNSHPRADRSSKHK